MMVNAFFEGSVLKIFANGNFAFSNDFYEYESRQVQVNGNAVTVYLQSKVGFRAAYVFELNENGVVTEIYQLNV